MRAISGEAVVVACLMGPRLYYGSRWRPPLFAPGPPASLRGIMRQNRRHGARSTSRQVRWYLAPPTCSPLRIRPPFDLEQVLKERFRLPAFYPWQREAIDAL